MHVEHAKKEDRDHPVKVGKSQKEFSSRNKPNRTPSTFGQRFGYFFEDAAIMKITSEISSPLLS